ncbi:MAG: putative structural protein [Prokaryotic dsDNA virus sp.]|nr:MAG: putative structural protein [Prokaryotic dsDNA virus sp.]|tara:strand:+ start:31060 stop:35865 length:4806 start_codon:yes stop_codon:yes gene_type:complete
MGNLKTTPRFINLDTDLRTLQPEEARYMLNARGYSSTGGKALSIENIKSQVEAIFPEANGENFVVGSISHPEKNDIYVFIWNAGGKHRIMRYNTISDTVELVLETSLFGFTKQCLIQGFAITSQSPSETLLYWTDGVTQPKKINVFRARQHTKGDYVNGYPNPLELEHIRWIKYPPVNAPSFIHGKDPNVGYNNLAENVFQFRYRYVHKDGERTAYSAASKATFSEYQLRNSVFQKQGVDFVYNYVDITLENAWNDVDKIEIIGKNSKSTEWVLIKTLDNDTNNDTQTYRFYNDDVYNATDSFETAKSYDAVPLRAVAVENVFNRAIFGNAVDGYDSLLQYVLDDQQTFNARYGHRSTIESTDITETHSINVGTDEAEVTFDTSGLSVSVGDVFFINFSIVLASQAPIFGSAKVSQGIFYFTYTANDTDTISDVVDNLANIALNATNDDLKIYSAVNSSNDLVLGVDFIGLELIDSINNVYNNSNKATSYLTESSNKAGARHAYGVIYEDEAGRNGSVQKGKNNSPYVKWFSERGGDISRGVAHIDARVGYAPPIWAKRYKFVYGGNSSVGKFLQYTVGGAYTNVNNVSGNGDTSIYVSLNNFKGGIDDGGHAGAYRNSTGALPDYQFNEGDMVRIISYVPEGSSNGEADRVYVDENLTFKVIDFKYLDSDENTNPIYTQGSKNNWGWTLILEDPNRGDEWSYSWLANNPFDSNWSVGSEFGKSNSAFIEIYSPNTKNTEDVYYETSYSYEIGNAGLPTRYHKCERDQYAEYTLPQSDIFGVEGSNASVLYDTTDFQLYIGDTVNFSGGTASPAGDFIVTDMVQNSNISEIYQVYFNNPLTGATNAAELGDTVLKHKFAAVTIKEGDVWFKPRRLINGTLPENGSVFPRNEFYDGVEDYYANDFFESNVWSCKGRVQAFSEYAKQETRKAGTWLSEAYFPSNNTNGLSTFNLSNEDIPLKEYDRSLGSIQRLWRRGDELIMFQENKVSFVRVGKDVLTTGDGGDIITLTSSVLSEQNPYKGDYGICMNPESFAAKDGNAYFLDIKRGKVMRLGSDGLTPISDYKISKLLDELSLEYNSIVNSTGFKAYGGFDREHDEYNLTFGQVVISKTIVDDEELPYETPQMSFIKKTPIVLTDGGITAGEVHTVNLDLLPLDVQAGDTTIISLTESTTLDAGDPEVTEWYTSYTTQEGDDENTIINALGASLVDEIEGNTLMGSYINNGMGVLSLNFERTDTGTMTAATVVNTGSIQRRVTDVDPTDIKIELPIETSRIPRGDVLIDNVLTEVDIIDFEQLSTDSVIYLNKTTTEEYKTGKIPIGISVGDLILEGNVDAPQSSVDIPLDNNGVVVEGNVEKIVTPLTIAFHEGSNTWAGFRSYTPNGYAATNYILLSFKDGEIWKHDRGTDYNSFYGKLYTTEVTAVLPQESGTNKVFNSISTESNIAFEVQELYTNLTSTSFKPERFSKKEGIWYADIPRATSTTSGNNTNVFGIGGIDSQSGANITFQNKINEVGISVGDELINSNGTVALGAVLSIVDDFTVSVNGNVIGTQGDFVYGVKNSKADGEAARGVYLVVKLRNLSNEFVELFAVNTDLSVSNLTLNQT